MNDGNWHSLIIPIADITAAAPTINLTLIKNLFLIKTSPGVSIDFANYVYFIDDIYLSGNPKLGLFTKRNFSQRIDTNFAYL